MKIRAIRLREVGCFSTAVAVEGFSGGLDVLAGHNELGKSTLLKGLRLLFTAKQSANTKDLQRLRPYGGGAPMIEADFEADGALWRLRKQYLNERQAVLTNVDTGKVVARADEAHQAALDLIGEGGAEKLINLLWLEQSSTLEPARYDDAAREPLSLAIEREVQTASGGQELRAIRALAEQQRKLIVTPGQARATGDYKKALAERDAVQQQFDTACAAAQAAEERIITMQGLKERYAHLTAPSLIAERRDRVKRLTAAREEAKAARQNLQIADGNLKVASGRQAAVRQNLKTLTGQLDQWQALLHAIHDGRSVEEQARATLEQAIHRATAARTARDDLRAALEREQEHLKQRDLADRRREARLKLSQIQTLLAEARSAVRLREDIRAELAAEAITESLVATAEQNARAMAALEVRISASLPKVRIAYTAGGAGRMRADGQALQDGAQLMPARPLVIDIDGIGTITIDPALSENAQADHAELERLKGKFAELLAGADVADLEEARQRLAARRERERELQKASDALAARAPNGIEALVDEEQRLHVDAQGEDAADLPERPIIEAEVDRLTRARNGAEQEFEDASHAQARAQEILARSEAERTARDRRIAELEDVLPPVEERGPRLKALQDDGLAADEAVNAVVVERGAWLEKALDDTRMRALDAELSDAAKAELSLNEEIKATEQSIKVLEVHLERDMHDGVDARVRALQEDLTIANSRVAQFEADRDALGLLLDVIGEVEQQSRDLYLAPVTSRLEHYAQMVFPGARIGMDRALGVETLHRDATPEQIAVLSKGTQEQIAVLVRLAFARLLADTGWPGPLILDDALVYADDSRIEAIFGALRAASVVHQVVVLTCRTRTFETLGGTRLTIQPWEVK